ncbi:hypothetical protein B0H10DRAFT_1954365 [Mycena sp. CBHHK59/15]|nr:hypothetical protein B0H10DRAFT_1954365 [Mycena sp. CBHHK59/15]
MGQKFKIVNRFFESRFGGFGSRGGSRASQTSTTSSPRPREQDYGTPQTFQQLHCDFKNEPYLLEKLVITTGRVTRGGSRVRVTAGTDVVRMMNRGKRFRLQFQRHSTKSQPSSRRPESPYQGPRQLSQFIGMVLGLLSENAIRTPAYPHKTGD